MKCYNSHTYQKLGFDTVLQRLRERTLSEEARELCDQLAPVSDAQEAMDRLRKTHEFAQLLTYDDPMPLEAFASVSRLMRKLQAEGNWLSLQELNQLLGWLRGVKAVRQYMNSREARYPHLYALVQAGMLSQDLIPRIERILDPHGNLRDDASPELASIRRQIGSASTELRTTLYRILRKANEQNWSIEREVTLRNDRLVIPVRADAKGRVPGFIHDISQSGGTVYVEPAEVLPLNNQLRELQIREQNEIIRILQEVTAFIRPHREALEQYRERMAELDFTRAKARLANEMDARLPVVEPEGKQLRIRHARYPLLIFRAQEQPFEVIPLEMHLDPQRRIVVISGPNAGGKSVSLKTVGLLQLMLQCGLLVPADETSVFPLFGSLFLDIGDEQSVESDLSTYTSRLYQWRQMGDHMDSRSLFLIDEFGSGTDPKQGGAIAEAFLERFVHQKAYGIITTHYGNLKDYAEVTPGVMNAAMQFDTEGLRPTYRFIEGMPGRSYAFEMAQRVGVHPTILKKARKKVGADELESEHLLRELERKHVEMGRLVADNQRKELELNRLLEQNRKQQQDLAAKKNGIVREAREEARALIRQANQQIERTIREIRESQADQARTRQARKALEAALPPPDPVLDAPPPETVQEEEQDGLVLLPGEAVQAGDWVKLRQGEAFGRLAEVQGTRAILESGDLRLTVKVNQLVKIRPPKAARQRGGVTVLGDLPSSTARFELDVMGMRAEAALAEVDKFIDEARMAGLTPVRILHGKGGGVLRETIRRHLSGIHVVRRTYDAPADAGGAGWTIVELDA